MVEMSGDGEPGGPGPDAEEEAAEGALEILQEGRLDGRVAARVLMGKMGGEPSSHDHGL